MTMSASQTAVHLDGVLGHGGSSIVYRARIGDAISAVKIITNVTFAATETEALQRLGAASVVGVPRIVCKVSESNVIVTSPVGCALAATSFDVEVLLTMHRAGQFPPANQPRLINTQIVQEALAILQSLHGYGVIHGDPRISNFIVVDEAIESSVSCAPSAKCVAIDFGCSILGTFDHSAALWRYSPRNPFVWVSLPYAPPVQLRAYASNTEYEPKPWHDLFMLAASLYRLLGHSAPQARDQREALVLAKYWELLMHPAADHASAGGPAADVPGRLFTAACANDIVGFERAAAELMRLHAVDWPLAASR